MIDSVRFVNFKSLKDATLPLRPFTLLVGPNGSGKSSAMQALKLAGGLAGGEAVDFGKYISADADSKVGVQVIIHWAKPNEHIVSTAMWPARRFVHEVGGHQVKGPTYQAFEEKLKSIRIYSLNAAHISQATALEPNAVLDPTGYKLPVVLDQLRDQQPERFEALNAELGRWLPEFDRVLFETDSSRNRAILLRTRQGNHAIPATELSQGVLLALALLTLAYVPRLPQIVCLEEPDRGIHPRLLRDVRDAIYRLCYPKDFGEDRGPVQVLATTHSPYFLDLYSEHPEEVVIAHKEGLYSHFQRLSDRSDLKEILEDSKLGDVWYSGVLGGVPAK